MGEREVRDDKWYYSFLPNNMAGGSTSPLIPLFVTEALGGTVGQVGLISAVTSMASVPSNIMWGNLSDAFKKRRMFVLIGFGGMVVAMVMMAFAISFSQYLLANFMLGLLSTAAAPVGTVLILESFKKEEWAKRLGDFSKVGGIGWLIGLLLGTVWLGLFTGGDPSTPMRALFLLAAVLAGVSMVLAYKLVPEPEEKVDRATISSALSRIPLFHFERARYLPQRLIHVMKLTTNGLRIENFPACLRRYYVFTFVTFTGFLCFYVAFPIYLKQAVGMSTADVFIIYMASSLASALTYSQAGRWATRVGSKRLQAWSVAARVVLFPSFFVVAMLNLPFTWLLVAFCVLHGLIGFCWANISVAGSHIVSNICHAECRAESTGMYNAMQGTANIAGALIGGFIALFLGYLAVFVVSSAFLIVGLLILTRIEIEGGPCADKPAESSC
jgi:MFS family permease